MNTIYVYNRGNLRTLGAYQAPKKRKTVHTIFNTNNALLITTALTLVTFVFHYYNII